MFEKILFCTDLSEYAHRVLECTMEIPGAVEIVLLHVVDAGHPGKRGWVYDKAIGNARIELDEQKEQIHKRGILAKVRLEVITEGDIAGTVVSVAGEEKSTVLVMGARGRSIITGLLLGSTSARVLRTASTPVLIERTHPGSDTDSPSCAQGSPGRLLTKVMFPTDFSGPAGAALEELRSINGIGALVLFHVVTQGETTEELSRYVDDAKEKLKHLAEELRPNAQEVTYNVRIGSPVEEIRLFAAEEEISLIIMSSRGESLLRTIFIGSTSFEVVRRSGCPVLVVR